MPIVLNVWYMQKRWRFRVSTKKTISVLPFLQNKDARIIISGSYENAARLILCAVSNALLSYKYNQRRRWSKAFRNTLCLVYYLFHKSLSKAFLTITFLLLVFSSWNIHDVCQRFLCSQKRSFSRIRQKIRTFPIEPNYKNRPLL